MRSRSSKGAFGGWVGGILLATGLAVAGGSQALEYRSVATPAVLYDAPSQKGRKLFIVRRHTPVELVVVLEGWVKVRDADGSLAWIERKSLADKRTVVVTAASADIRQDPDAGAPLVFDAVKGVALDLVELAKNGWAKVAHPDGQSGFVRAAQVWGL